MIHETDIHSIKFNTRYSVNIDYDTIHRIMVIYPVVPILVDVGK